MAAPSPKRSALARLAAVLRGSALLIFSSALLVLGVGSLLVTTCFGLLTSGDRSTADSAMLQQWLVFGAVAAGIGLSVGVGWVVRFVTAESTRKKLAGLPPSAIAPATTARLRIWLAGLVLSGMAVVAASAITVPLPIESWFSLGSITVVPGGLALLLMLPAPRIWALDLAMAVPFHWAIVGLWPARIHPGQVLLERAPVTLAGPPRFIVAVTVGVVVYALARQVRNALGREDRDRAFFLVVVLVLLEWTVGSLLERAA